MVLQAKTHCAHIAPSPPLRHRPRPPYSIFTERHVVYEIMVVVYTYTVFTSEYYRVRVAVIRRTLEVNCRMYRVGQRDGRF